VIRPPIIVTIAFGGLAALGVAGAQQAAFAQGRPPELIEITPASGPAGEAYPLRATIRGTGFMPAGNVVEFGPLKIPDLPSADGVRITFQVPKLLPSRSEVPPMVLTAGDYRVTVSTPAGTSNALTLTLTRGPEMIRQPGQ
jgi:hypothetical protein